MEAAGLRTFSGGREETEAALARFVADGQAKDPLAPIAVLIGRTQMRPYLQRRLATLNGGIANVHFLTASELALALGERVLIDEGRLPLPPLADRVLLRQIGGEHDGYFEPARDTPGFGEALHRLTRELRSAGYDAAAFDTAGPCLYRRSLHWLWIAASSRACADAATSAPLEYTNTCSIDQAGLFGFNWRTD